MSGYDFLDRMAQASRERARQARMRVGEGELTALARARNPAPQLQLSGKFDVIAELKLRSPAAGTLATTSFDAARQVEAYATGGACAVSVLTEPDEFQGDLQHLAMASQQLLAHQRPTMRKDFLTDPYQVIEARAHGAGGVLVIVTMLGDAQLLELVECASEYELFVLLEAFDEDDLERIANLPLTRYSQPMLGGVNCRDLKSLQVDFTRFAELADLLPDALPIVAESGISSIDDVVSVADSGYRLALIGSALMASEDPSETLQLMIDAGRARRRDNTSCS